MKQALHQHTTLDDFPRLPGRYQRGDVIRIVTSVAPRLGLGAGALRALLTMIHTTRAADWTGGTCTPTCYREQTKVAQSAGVTTRTMRNNEAVLERLGLVEKIVGADGSRGRFCHGEIVHGISFRPLIERFSELAAMADEIEALTAQIEVFRRKCTAARRAFTRALSELLDASAKHPDIPALLALKAGLPRRYDGLGLDELAGLFDTLDNAVRTLHDLLNGSPESTDTPEIICRPHIQATTEPDLESCSGSTADNRPARKRAAPNTYVAAPVGATNCRENKDEGNRRGHKPELTETFSPRQLYWMASEDMRMYLDAVCASPHRLTAYDFTQAAISILPALGVNPSAWDEAAETMGDLAAALSVLVIDANRHHPERPIHSPGGALRAFARLAASGRLNLHGSLIGLKQRMEARKSASADEAK